MDKKILILSVAGLSLEISAGREEYSFDYSPCHLKFLEDHESFDHSNSSPDRLYLELEDTPISPQSELTRLQCQNEIWELWRDKRENFVFTQPKQEPQRWVFIEPGFERGKIVGDFNAHQGSFEFPLQYLDIVIYSNWLAKYSDLILHASGFALQGEGYCFLGDSGVGKSTLVRDLAKHEDLTVLGEDQIVLRKIDQQFMVFGTPWHETAKMCSPMGVPLKKVFFLNRQAALPLTSLSGDEAVVRILQTAFYPIYRPEVIGGIIARLGELPGKAGFFELAYERGTDVLSEILNA